MNRKILLVTISSLLLATATAHAQEARELFQRGQAAYETGDYATAAQQWEQAYQLDPRPLLQYNLAQAYERLGRLDEAAQAYQAYIDASDASDGRVEIAQARLASLRARLQQTSIHLTGGVDGAAIFIDDEDRGRLPHPDPLRVNPGSHRIVVRADGYQDFVSVVGVSAGQSIDVPVELRSESSPPVAGGSGGLGISLTGTIVAASGGAILLATAVTGPLALSAAGKANTAHDSQAQSARTLALTTDILFAVGGAAAATGVLLMFLLHGDELGGGTARVTPVLGPGYAGVAGTF